MAEGGQDLRGRNENATLEPIIAGIATLAEADHVCQNFENTTVNVVARDQTNITINEHHFHTQHAESPGYQSTNDHLELDAQKGFLTKTKLHLRKEIGFSESLPGYPTIMVVDMKERDTRHSQPVTDNPFGRDVEKIRFDQIHDAQHDKSPKHVMILGEAGAGKTTLSKSYCLAVNEGNVMTLANIQLVHFVQAATLQHRSTTTAFNLLFTDQMAHDPDTELSLQEQEAGQKWLKINSAKMLIVIDGLDQCLEEFGLEKYPIVTATTLAKANDIIANIMSNKIWRGARVLTTTRWSTYWEIKADQKPSKTVGLRGLDDTSMRKIAFSKSIDGDHMLNSLKNAPPGLMVLCRNPMFFNYTTTLVRKDPSALPTNLSGLMSAFFRVCLGPLSKKHYDGITRLAYNAMRENKFVFSHSYLNEQGVDPNVLNNFLSTGAILDDGQDTPSHFDKLSTFSHQTMQEFCCALHVVNLNRDEVKDFANNQLNDRRMEFTRQLLYGLILNDEVTKPMQKYLANRQTSIQECRRILMSSLHDMIKNCTIRDMETICLLSDCGDETIQKIKQNVHSIELNGRVALNGPILLANIVKRLSPLQEVYCEELDLEPSMIGHFLKIHSYVQIFKVETVTIVDASLTKKNLTGYLILFRLFRSKKLVLRQCHLDKEDDEIFTHVLNGIVIQPDLLGVIDESMNEDGYEVFAHIAKLSKCKQVMIKDSRLTKTKLQGLLRGCRNHATQLARINISDDSMDEHAYEKLTCIVKLWGCIGLVFEKCLLTKTKLSALSRGCRNQNIQLQTLVISCEAMNEDECEQLTHLLKDVRCSDLHLLRCGLTTTKFRVLSRGCQNKNIKLGGLFISDSAMQPGAYDNVTEVLKVTKCQQVYFRNSTLDKKKLEYFGVGCMKNRLTLHDISLQDKSMKEEGYEVVGHILKLSKCKALHLVESCLTKRKLQRLVIGCRTHGTQLPKLTIKEKSMQEDVYEEFSHIVKLSGCSELAFNECSLTSSTLRGLLRGCRNQNIQLQKLSIYEPNATATHDDVSALCDLMTYSVDRLSIYYWMIDGEGVRRLEETIQFKDSQAYSLFLPDGIRRFKKVS